MLKVLKCHVIGARGSDGVVNSCQHVLRECGVYASSAGELYHNRNKTSLVNTAGKKKPSVRRKKKVTGKKSEISPRLKSHMV